MVNPLVAAAVPGLIQAGSSLLGKFFGGDPKEDAKDMAKYVGSHAIQWRVNDANKAGIHPLYALGASVINNAPSVVGDDSSWTENMGQGLARSADAMLSTEGRMRAGVEKLALERSGLENELLRARIATERAQLANSVTRNPAIPGQGNTIVFPDGSVWPVSNPTLSQAAENAYGEPGEWIFGGGALAQDFIKNASPVIKKLWQQVRSSRLPIDDAVMDFARKPMFDYFRGRR